MRKNKHSSQSLVLTSSSQLYALRRRMEESGITHGQSVLANINYVYISNGKISFWNMPALEILEHITPGDGGRIAQQVILRGPFRVRENIHGYFNIKNVCISSHGTINLTPKKNTSIKMVSL
jgi:hypothetical protein